MHMYVHMYVCVYIHTYSQQNHMQIHQAHTHTDTQAVSYAALTTTHVVRLRDHILGPSYQRLRWGTQFLSARMWVVLHESTNW